MNEPKTNLRQVSTRVDIEDYARIVQVLASGKFKDVSEYVRGLIHSDLLDVELSEESKSWIEGEKKKAVEARHSKRKRRRSFIVRVFGGK